MIAQIFVSKSLETRQQTLLTELSKHGLKREHPDVFYIDSEQKMGIEQARAIKDFFAFKPHQAKGKAVVVEELGNVTVDSQNALLKTLEEPPVEAIILFGSSSVNHLLPTVLSRCQVIIVNSDGTKEHEKKLAQKLLTHELVGRFQMIEKSEDKNALLAEIVQYYADLFEKDHTKLPFAKEILLAESWQKSNVNVRGILEYLALVLPKM